MATADLSAEQARKVFIYDPATGVMSRRNERARPFKARSNGYTVCGFGGKNYQVHRLAWLIHYGAWPVNNIDHINGIKTDNRIQNLRDVTQTENARNRDSYKGAARIIGPILIGGSWHVSLPDYEETRTLGPFADHHEAAAVYAKEMRWASKTEGRSRPQLR